MRAIGLASAAARTAVLTGAGGPLIGRRAGQRLARHELAELTFWQRVLEWISRLSAGNAVPGGWFGLIALAVLAVLAVTVVLFWVRPGRARRSAAQAVLGGESMTAADYRRAAQRLAAAGDFAGAIVEGVRAIAAELGERDILPPRPGRTADELAAEAGLELPGLAGDLRDVTRLFDDIRYGDKGGSQAGYQLVRRVDENVRAARPAAIQVAQPAVAGFGVPR
jgi:type II secretory pathway pseudopilin PulG